MLQRMMGRKTQASAGPKTHTDGGHALPSLRCLAVIALKVLSAALLHDGIGGLGKGSGLRVEAEVLWEREPLR